MGEYTISKGENTIYLTSKEEPMKLSAISMWESTQYLRGRIDIRKE